MGKSEATRGEDQTVVRGIGDSRDTDQPGFEESNAWEKAIDDVQEAMPGVGGRVPTIGMVSHFERPTQKKQTLIKASKTMARHMLEHLDINPSTQSKGTDNS